MFKHGSRMSDQLGYQLEFLQSIALLTMQKIQAPC